MVFSYRMKLRKYDPGSLQNDDIFSRQPMKQLIKPCPRIVYLKLGEVLASWDRIVKRKDAKNRRKVWEQGSAGERGQVRGHQKNRRKEKLWMRDASRDCVPCTAATGLPYHLARRDDFDRFCRQPPLGRSLRVGGMRGKLQLVARVHGFVSKRYKPFTLDKGNETKNSNLKGGWTRGVAMNARRPT
jgi:hypothetical protein